MKYPLYVFAILVMMCVSCKNDDPDETKPEGTYTKEWVLDINDQFGLDKNAGGTYSAILLDDSRLLVNQYITLDWWQK